MKTIYILNYLYLEQIPFSEKDVLFMSTRTCPPQGTLKSETKIFEYRAELLEKAKPA